MSSTYVTTDHPHHFSSVEYLFDIHHSASNDETVIFASVSSSPRVKPYIRRVVRLLWMQHQRKVKCFRFFARANFRMGRPVPTPFFPSLTRCRFSNFFPPSFVNLSFVKTVGTRCSRESSSTGEDKARDRERVREKHLKRRLKGRDREEGAAGAAPTLGGVSSADSSAESEAGSDGSDNSDGSSFDAGEGSESSDDNDERDSRSGGDTDSSDREDSGGRRAGGAKAGLREDSKSSRRSNERRLEDQEDEVLALLAARHGK